MKGDASGLESNSDFVLDDGCYRLTRNHGGMRKYMEDGKYM